MNAAHLLKPLAIAIVGLSIFAGSEPASAADSAYDTSAYNAAWDAWEAGQRLSNSDGNHYLAYLYSYYGLYYTYYAYWTDDRNDWYWAYYYSWYSAYYAERAMEEDYDGAFYITSPPSEVLMYKARKARDLCWQAYVNYR